jgi:hypothetical protein
MGEAKRRNPPVGGPGEDEVAIASAMLRAAVALGPPSDKVDIAKLINGTMTWLAVTVAASLNPAMTAAEACAEIARGLRGQLDHFQEHPGLAYEFLKAHGISRADSLMH